ncbi:MAG: hypothetical protein DRJ99_02580 [Thermoplasmata archaeon]|nr:MAG: hypothetical protein DRJ99_02580 [Thermoplasmata archaeon]RLF61838.1 MAG: hypothetical protein DRN16_03110 [Thermoplasmata archaeon]
MEEHPQPMDKEEIFKSKAKKWTRIVLTIAILYLVWMIFVFSTIYVLGFSYTWSILTFDTWITIGIILYVILIIMELIIILYYLYLKREKKLKAPIFEEVEEEEKKTITYTYPKDVEGGVFSSNYIDVDENTVLKLRTLLVRACMLCGKRVECWPKYRGKVDKEDFLANIDCIDGLERLSKKKRKKTT